MVPVNASREELQNGPRLVAFLSFLHGLLVRPSFGPPGGPGSGPSQDPPPNRARHLGRWLRETNHQQHARPMGQGEPRE